MTLDELIDEEMKPLYRMGIMHESHVRGALLRVASRAKTITDPYTFDGDGRGPFIHVYRSNSKYYPFSPRVEEVQIEDIAHGLSTVCRFGGHCPFYSVAEHSVNVSVLMQQRYGTKQDALLGLMHDAAEGYLWDVPRPLKYTPPFAAYRELEKRNQAIIYKKWNLMDWAVQAEARLRWADDTLLATEKKELFEMHTPQANEDLPEPLRMRLMKWVSAHAENQFMQRYALVMNMPD